MARNYKIKNMLNNLPFYSTKIKKFKKRSKNLQILDFSLSYHSFLKNLKN